MDLVTIIFQWIIVFIINIIPAFAPPTWIVLSYFYISNPQDIFLLILIGVTASTVGRYVLAKFSGKVFFKFASEQKKIEVEKIRKRLHKRNFAKFMVSFIFAIGPLPSNAFFIAVGSTKMRMREILSGFFLGRLISYLFLVYTSEKLFSSFETTLGGEATIITLILEIVSILALILFFFLDWNKILELIDRKKK